MNTYAMKAFPPFNRKKDDLGKKGEKKWVIEVRV